MNAGCGTEDDPLDAIYSYEATIETTMTGTLIAGTGLVDNLHVDTLTYDEEYWDDARAPVTAVKVSGVKPPTWTDYMGGQVLAFGDEAVAGNEESVSFLIQLPHSYKEGSDIEVHVHYALPVAAGGTQVRWQLDYAFATVTEAIAASPTLYALTGAADAADTHYLTSFSYISGTGKKISSIILGSLKRNSSDALDTYVNDAYLLEIDAHFQQDSPGSTEEDTK